MDQVLERLLHVLKDYIPMTVLVLMHHDFRKNCFQRLGFAAFPPLPPDKQFPEFLHVKESVAYVEHAFRQAPTPIIIHKPDADPLTKAYLRQTGLRAHSFMGLPLIHNQNRVGGLVCTSEEKNLYTKEHQALFQLLHEPMALALSNSIRYREILSLKNQYAFDNQEWAKKLSHSAEEEVIGGDNGLATVMEHVRRVAVLDSSVLILGETGVGKDVIANAIKNLSKRKDAPFLKIDCGTIPETLLESELFGHEKGAFTGADTRKKGSFELANGGTVFLDEIGELSPAAQVKFLRLLQNREIVRVGGQQVISLNIRIICATHRNLPEMVTQGSFREDLWYRLNVFPIHVPPLRDRKQDIPVLVSHLIRKKVKEMNMERAPVPSNIELSELAAYDWPGNIRELQNVLERWLILGCGSVSFHAILNPKAPDKEPVCDAPFAALTEPEQLVSIEEMNKEYIEAALRVCNQQVGGKGGAAECLRIPRSTLRSRMKKLGITAR